VNVEGLIAKVINKPYCFCKGDDEMITLLALECAKLDARMTAQIFHQIPFIYYLNGEAIGMECARNDPSSTLEFIDNFKKRLNGFHKTHMDNIIKEANRHLNPI
jgi:type I site-specific restriction endonuclease